MKHQHISRLEAHLEKLVEGTFAHLFGRKIRVQDIALQLARAMRDGVIPYQGQDSRPIAPDNYLIYSNPKIEAHLTQNYPQLPIMLCDHLIELATQSGYRIINRPIVKIFGDAQLELGKILVVAEHSNYKANSTAALQRVDIPQKTSKYAQLIIGETRSINLQDDVINIGRSPDNHIIVDDPHTSRNHIQLRLRFNAYWVFDSNSQSGTFVNDTRIIEHQLQSGDIIVIGKTKILYIEDDTSLDSDLDQTEAFDPI